jgi:hypothetical protein
MEVKLLGFYFQISEVQFTLIQIFLLMLKIQILYRIVHVMFKLIKINRIWSSNKFLIIASKLRVQI